MRKLYPLLVSLILLFAGCSKDNNQAVPINATGSNGGSNATYTLDVEIQSSATFAYSVKDETDGSINISGSTTGKYLYEGAVKVGHTIHITASTPQVSDLRAIVDLNGGQVAGSDVTSSPSTGSTLDFSFKTPSQ